MKSTDNRLLFNQLIGADAAASDIATIPPTQAAAGNGRASIATAFPPETFIPRAAGGNPPYGSDMNGFLNLLSSAIQVLQSGFLGPFDATFAQSIGGYPAGAIVSGSAAGTFWVSTADANVSVPGATGAAWQSLFNGLAVLNGGNTFTGPQNIAGPLNVTGTITALLASSTQKITLRRGSSFGGINSYDGSNWHYLYIDDDDTATTAKGTLAFSNAAQTFTETQTFSGQTLVPDITVFTGKDALNADTAEGRYQPKLGFTPVQQGGGIGQATNKIYIGWGDNNLKVTVDQTDIGNIALQSQLPTSGTITGGTYTKTPMNDGTGRSVLVQSFYVANVTRNSVIAFPISYPSDVIPTISVAFQDSGGASAWSNIMTLTNANCSFFLRYHVGSTDGDSGGNIWITVQGIIK